MWHDNFVTRNKSFAQIIQQKLNVHMSSLIGKAIIIIIIIYLWDLNSKPCEVVGWLVGWDGGTTHAQYNHHHNYLHLLHSALHTPDSVGIALSGGLCNWSQPAIKQQHKWISCFVSSKKENYTAMKQNISAEFIFTYSFINCT